MIGNSGDAIVIDDGAVMIPQQLVDMLEERQNQVLNKMRENQAKWKDEMEAALRSGLEKITEISFGAQAKEFRDDAETEHIQLGADFVQTIEQVKEEIRESQRANANVLSMAAEKWRRDQRDSETRMEKNLQKFSDKLQDTQGAVSTLGELADHMGQKFSQQVEGVKDEIFSAVAVMAEDRVLKDKDQGQGKADLVGGSSRHVSRKRRDERADSTSSSLSGNGTGAEGSDSDEEMPVGSSRRMQTSRSGHHGAERSHIPAFTGKETFKVWFSRFKDIAKRQSWDDDEKLDILLPRLQGEAGSFVFDQLSSKVRNNYSALKHELQNRFRTVENPKTFSAMFTTRKQKTNESVENYAADLKKLYAKAFARRDPRTREEDLLRRFLDGLQDGKAAFHVEFVKDPKNIDIAVDEVINFSEVNRDRTR